MNCGAVSLTVPIVDDIIQVGAVGRLPTATIDVHKTPWTMSVRRRDGAALQAQIIRQTDNGSVLRSEVFGTPVPMLWLRRTPHSERKHPWLLMSGQQTGRNPDLLQLITTIVAFSAAKQFRSAPLRRLSESA